MIHTPIKGFNQTNCAQGPDCISSEHTENAAREPT